MLSSEEAKQLWDLVEPLETAMLVTYEDNILQARPMYLAQKEFSGSFYFFTEHPTEKTEAIEHAQEVCLAFSGIKSQTFVSVSGRASLCQDKQLIAKLWNPFVASWFPQGKDSPSVALIKVDAYQAEYWQGKGAKVVQLFKYGKAYLTGKRPNIGEHGHL
ncbi:pyridoxamine 5'-phosphate oxidase family protein [Legionella sp. D16C41]|uniref:pyridoxamine 5'-phosphate oxidase family protein n=1 Tax=Legionella sp. D16C41 TaxID=3402688 RepID=UPI003AF50615